MACEGICTFYTKFCDFPKETFLLFLHKYAILVHNYA